MCLHLHERDRQTDRPTDRQRDRERERKYKEPRTESWGERTGIYNFHPFYPYSECKCCVHIWDEVQINTLSLLLESSLPWRTTFHRSDPTPPAPAAPPAWRWPAHPPPVTPAPVTHTKHTTPDLVPALHARELSAFHHNTPHRALQITVPGTGIHRARIIHNCSALVLRKRCHWRLDAKSRRRYHKNSTDSRTHRGNEEGATTGAGLTQGLILVMRQVLP